MTVTFVTDTHTDKSALTRSGAGFSLLELLVVIVIIAVLLGFATLSVGDGGLDKQLHRESRRLQALLQLASQEAVMRQVQIGVGFTRNAYVFFQWQATTQTWDWFDGDAVFQERNLPPPLHFTLHIEGGKIGLHEEFPPVPQVVLYSSAEITPFDCFLHAAEARSVYRLGGLFSGDFQLSLQRRDEIRADLEFYRFSEKNLKIY